MNIDGFVYNKRRLEIDGVIEEELKSVRKVYIIPEQVWSLTQTQNLTLRDAGLHELPSEISLFTNLTHLVLNENSLTTLPAEIGNLAKLKLLYVNSCKLNALPTEIGKLSSLENFEVYGNQLTTLPTEIGNLSRLDVLNIGRNHFKFLPASIANCKNLHTLFVSRNKYLKELPFWICHLPLNSLSAMDIRLKQEKMVLFAYSRPSDRLEFWKKITNSSVDLTKYQQLNPENKKIVNEWLKKLELSPLFATAQLKLAEMVCDLLDTICSDLTITQDQTGEVLFRLWSPPPPPVYEEIPPPEPITAWKEAALKTIEVWVSSAEKERFSTTSESVIGSEEIIIAGYDLPETPADLWEMGNLRHLTLGALKTPLPSAIGRLRGLTKLSLSGKLKSIPLELGHLTQLVELKLYCCDLESLPHSIGQLTRLESLNLTWNELTALPTTIGNLTALQTLSFQLNKLETLPSDISKCAALKVLNLQSNELESLPSFRELIHLEELYLTRNRLEYLPEGIGNCRNLTKLAFDHNPYLMELPMSLLQLTRLTTLSYENCGIHVTWELTYLISEEWKRKRAAESLTELVPKLNILKKYASLEEANLEAIEGFSKEEKAEIYEWLIRLERTKDFHRSQTQLATVLVNILESVSTNSSFKELFIVQITANNECCEDRAAMALNEIYTSWLITCLPEDTPLAKKLQIMTQAAKTLTLRTELGKLIPAHEQESVEIYLYFEIMLKEKLNLLTPIDQICYPEIGKRRWIDPDQLVEKVNQNYFTHLAALPAFEKLAQQELSAAWERITAEAHLALTRIGERPVGDDLSKEVLDWKYAQGQVLDEKKAAWLQASHKWYNQD